jgi:hypothetical protein
LNGRVPDGHGARGFGSQRDEFAGRAMLDTTLPQKTLKRSKKVLEFMNTLALHFRM